MPSLSNGGGATPLTFGNKMKMPSTYYSLLLTAANTWLTWCFPMFNDMISGQWKTDHLDAHLPVVTTLFLRMPWWPGVFAVLFLIVATIGVIAPRRSELLLHILIIGLMIEGAILFWATLGYAIPFVRIVSPMK
jgi:hypothetical protein